MSLYAVEHGMLAKLPFLEHGANYAIFALAVLLFGSLKFEEPEWLTGSIGLAFITLAVVKSLRYRKRNPLEAVTNLADEIGRHFVRPKLAAGISRIIFGVGWNVAEAETGRPVVDVDVDANAVAFDAQGRVIAKSYFRDLGSEDGWFHHTADDTSGASSEEGDDERIASWLDRIDEEVASLVLAVTIKSDHTLDDLKGAYCRLLDAAAIELDEDDEDILRDLEMERINLTLEGGSATGKVAGRVYRKRRPDGTRPWAFQPLDEDIPIGRDIDDPRVLAVLAAAATGNLTEIQHAQDAVLAMTAEESATPVV